MQTREENQARAATFEQTANPKVKNSSSQKIGYTFGELENLELTPREEIIRGLGRGENGLLNAVTNVGKSTLIRILALCLILGRLFPPLTVSDKKHRVCIIDTEDTLSFLRSDIRKMIAGFNEDEKQVIRENLLLICDVSFGNESLRINQPDHFRLLVDDIKKFKADIIFVDTVSSSFAIRNENDNAEIKENVMKPLKRFAGLTDAAVLASHHIGKSKLEDGATKEGAHKGRGASAFSDLSRVVFNLETDAAGGVILSCGKIKGEKFADTILLYDKETRWFSRQGDSKIVSTYETVLELFAEGKSYRRKEVDEMLDGEMSKATITRNLKSAVERGDLIREKMLYSKNTHLLEKNAHTLKSGNQNQTLFATETQQNQQLQKNAQMLTPYSDEHLSINGNGKPKNDDSTSVICKNCGADTFFDKPCQNCKSDNLPF